MIGEIISKPIEDEAAKLRELLDSYIQDVTRIFDSNPDIDQIKIRTLLQSYGSDVVTLMEFEFDGELGQHDGIKQFKQLTHTFRTEVLEIAHAGLKNT